MISVRIAFAIGAKTLIIERCLDAVGLELICTLDLSRVTVGVS